MIGLLGLMLDVVDWCGCVWCFCRVWWCHVVVANCLVQLDSGWLGFLVFGG